MRHFDTRKTLGLVLAAVLPACSDDDGVVVTEVDAGRQPAQETGEATNGADNTEPIETTIDASAVPPDAAADPGNTSAEPVGLDGGVIRGVDGSTPSNDGGSNTESMDEGDSATDPTTTEEPQQDALYVFGAQVYDGNTWLTYLATSPRLDAHVTLDDAIELQGRALAVGPDDLGVTYVTNGTTITRYRLDDSDELVAEEPTLSFAGVGVTDIHEYGGQFVFQSSNKSYFFDGDNSQVVVWNPAEMTVGQPIPLDIVPADVEGVTITSSAAPIRNGDQVITFVGLRQSVVPTAPAVVVVLDTEEDSARVVTDDRCGYVRDGVLASDGWVYLATEAYASAYQRINAADEIAEPCLLRFDPEDMEFDSEFHVELSSVFDGNVAGSMSVANNGSVFLKVLDEALAPITPESNARVVASAPAWRWASLDVGDAPTGSLMNLPPTSGSVTPFTLGGRRVVSTNRQAEVNGATITVSDLSAMDTAPSEVMGSVDGLVFSITKLR